MGSLLTILVVSRNRSKNIKQLLSQLSYLISYPNNENIEIVISDNSDDDSYSQIIEEFVNLNITLKKPPKAFVTAEEHLFWAWSHASGKFVWTLGDDDPIIEETFYLMIKELKKNQVDAIFWNSNLISPDGQILKRNRIPCKQKSFECSIEELAARAGIWYALSGFSTSIIRRNLIDSELATKWVNEIPSPIYSHVTFFIRVLKNKRVKFMNSPLVNYRMNYSDLDPRNRHWKNYAKIQNHYFRFPWLGGFVAQLEELQRESMISDDFLTVSFEQNHLGNRFLLVDIFVNLLIDQITYSTLHPSQRIPETELNLILSHTRRGLLDKEEFWQEIQNLNSKIWRGGFLSRLLRKDYLKAVKLKHWWRRDRAFSPRNWRLSDAVAGIEVRGFHNCFIDFPDDLNFIDFGMSTNFMKANYSKRNLDSHLQQIRERDSGYQSPEQWKPLRILLLSYLPLSVKMVIRKVFKK